MTAISDPANRPLLRFKNPPFAAAILFSVPGITFPVLAQQPLMKEIVLTGTRRLESLTDYPHNISTKTSEHLENSRGGEIGALARLIPGMTFLDAGPRNRVVDNNMLSRDINANPIANIVGRYLLTTEFD